MGTFARWVGVAFFGVIGGLLLSSALYVGLLWSGLWLLGWILIGEVASLAAKTSRTPRKVLAGFTVALVLIGMFFAVQKGLHDSAPALAAARAAETAQLKADNEAAALYEVVLADLRQQGLDPATFTTSSNDQKLTIVAEGHVKIRLYYQPTRHEAQFDVRRIELHWVLVCPTINGGWLPTYDRDNKLAFELNASGSCPVGMQ